MRVRRAIVVVAALISAFVLPSAAPGNTAGAAPALPGPASSLQDAFSKSPASFVQALLCPIATDVAHVASSIPGVNVLTDDLALILCALNVLGYAYRTTYYPPSGPPIVKYYHALVGVPALLDVNGDGLPDFNGLVGPTLGIPGIQFSLSRNTLFFPASGHAKIEAVFLDPIASGTWVGVGEDGSSAGTATAWRTNVGAFLSSGTSIDMQLSLTAQHVPTSLATFGEAFFGSNPDAPTDIDAGSAQFAPVPETFTTRLRIGPSSQEATINTTVRSTLTAHVQQIKPGDEKDIDAVVDQLPTNIDILHQTTSDGHDVTTYSADSVVDHVTAAYHDRAGSSILTAAQADITHLPSAFTLDQIDGKTSLVVTNGYIGAVEVRFATGQDVPAPGAGTGPYVSFHRFSSSHLTGGLRLANIQSVSFDQTGPYVGDIVFSTPPGLIPLSFQDDVSGITATGHLSNLPAHLTVTIDLVGGHVVFDGHGTGIDEIAVNATSSPTPFFARAKRIDLTIDGLPALDTIDFAPNGKAVTFTPSAPIGSVSMLASDGTAAPVKTGDYASYEDTPALYRIFLQMQSIAGVSFSTSPVMTATLKTGVSQPMVLFAHIADQPATHDITFNGAIKNLPTSISVTADLTNGKIVYNASSAISEIDVSANDAVADFFQRANTLALTLKGLPATNTITFLPNGQAVTFTPSAPIDSVSLLASDGTAAPVKTGDYASYEDTPSLYRIFLQMQSIAGVAFQTGGVMTATLKTGVSQPMVLFAHLADQSATHDLTFNGAIKDLPTNITVTADLGGGKVTYNASSSINEIDVTAKDTLANFFGRVNTLGLTLKGLPATNTITFLPNGQAVTFTPSAPIDSVSLLASDGTGAPSVTGDYASYEDTPSLYRIYLQMVGISGVSFNAATFSGTLKTSSPQVMNLFGHIQSASNDLKFNGSIDKLPSWIDFSLTTGGGGSKSVDYNTHGQAIDKITLDGSGVNLPFDADTIHAEIDHIPSHITVTIPAPGGTAVFDPHGDHIDRVLVQVYPHATGAYNSVAGHQTAYANLNTGQFTADIQNIGLTQFTTGTSNINIQYDVSSAPLDAEFDNNDGTYFKAQISNPEPASITVNTDNRTQIDYTVNNASSNFTGNGEINGINVQTNVSGGYLDASLQHIAPKLHICFDGGGSTACTPGFVPRPGFSFNDSDGKSWLMPNSSFDFQLVPTALNGTAWPTRFRLDGTFCFSEPDAATCTNSSNKKERIQLSDLEFGKVAVGVGSQGDDCTACTAGRLYDYFDTDNTNISGDVKYYKSGDDDPFVEYHTDSSTDGIAAQNQFLFAQYCAPCLNADLLDTVSGGSFTCNGSPHLDINTFVDVDVLSGSLIHICP